MEKRRNKVSHPMRFTEECPATIPEGMEFCKRCGFYEKGDDTCIPRHHGLLLLLLLLLLLFYF